MGAIIIFLVTLGLAAFLHARTDLPAAVCPAAVIAGQILTLYLLSLLGLLEYGPYLLIFAGMAGLVWTLIRKRETWKDLFSPGIVLFAVYAAVLWRLNAGSTPDGFDNYSHWALAAKELYLTHALPGPDTLVTMTNYPPAVPLYQYFVLRLAGFSEGAMLGANGLLFGAQLCCLFGDCRWKDWKRWLLCTGLMAALTLVIPNCSMNLQVDALLGAMALALGCMALWDDEKTRPMQGAAASVLVLTKMSGAVLAALHLAFLLCLRRRRKDRRALLGCFGWCAMLPAGLYGLFLLRIHRIFAESLGRNQFQVDAGAFGAKLAAKSPEFWASFPGDFWRAIWDGQTGASVFFMVGNAVLAVILVLFLLKIVRPPKRGIFVIVFSWAALAVYTVSLAGMYVFMMDEHESIILASFYRYFGTGVLYQLGLCAAVLTGGEEDWRPLPALLLTASFALGCAGALKPESDWEVRSRSAREELRRGVLSVREEVTAHWDGETMLYCAYDQTHLNEDYVYRFVRYAFYSRGVRPMGPGLTRQEDLQDGGRCYILWLEDDAWAIQALTNAGIEVPEVPGLYEKDADLTLLWTPEA